MVELANSGNIESKARIKINVGDREKSTIAVVDT